ncbi:hypothetical protein [Sphingomonas sp.]|jgi:hypothetical protein|uniref:hypothetical protein n=1 Tax=Sphingomonas sp. TaxID=28214 RepID=UPI002D803864|nr:hypothetical protein [Sphingomonas sp.]HEU0045465.1 hypothetical protein [Sphingomonas sp.]
MSFESDEGQCEQREHAREKRRRRHLLRLGFADPRCLFCGEDDVRCLQLDHTDGIEFDAKSVWPLCANCHAKRTDLQKDHPPKNADPADPLERAGRKIEGLADYLEMAVTELRHLGPIWCADAAARSPRRRRDGNDNDCEVPSG